MESCVCMETAAGKLYLSEKDGKITRLGFQQESVPVLTGQSETPVLRMAVKQLEEYFAGERKTFSLPLAPAGTDFQRRVWNALMEIPYGKTYSYKQVAELVGNAKASRAVGLANNRNPIAIIIPCHRVIGSNGSLTGYAGGLGMKQMLLDLEKRYLG